MATVSGAVPLYASAKVDVDALMRDVRASDFLAEIVSGEEDVEASPLWHLVRLVRHTGADEGAAAEDAAALPRSRGEWTDRAMVLADERPASGDGSVLVVQLAAGVPTGRLRVARGSLLEVAASLSAGASIDEVRAGVRR